MAGLAEGVATRVAFKFYTDPDITPGTAAVSASDPGAASAQILRRVSSTLSLQKDTFQSEEIRSDRQVGDYRHGVKRVSGNVAGELSPLTYEQWFEASMRGTWAAALSKSNTELTSVEAANATSKFTFGGGNPVTEGLRVGMVKRFASLSESANNAKNFLILGFGGSNNREVTVYPAPTDMTADSAFTLSTVGRSLIIPSSAHVKRKLAIEHWNEDKDIAELFTECRIGGFTLQVPAQGMANIDFEVMGRDLETFSGGSAPFFATTPIAATTTGILAGVNGLLRVSGETVAVVTGLSIQHQLALSGDAVLGSTLLPDILAGRHVVSGQITANFEDLDLIDDFRNESEIELLAYLTATSADASPAMTFYLPRIKLGGASKPAQGEGAQIITLPFTALKYEGTEASTGIANTSLQIWDSEVTS